MDFFYLAGSIFHHTPTLHALQRIINPKLDHKFHCDAGNLQRILSHPLVCIEICRIVDQEHAKMHGIVAAAIQIIIYGIFLYQINARKKLEEFMVLPQ